ncbi:MAG: tail fiber domain-containing protein, partial [Oscillospiraceae bacterium]
SNTAIGKQALKFKQSGGFNETFFNCVGLGYGARVAGSNEIQLGDSATTVYTYGAVQNRSDKRDKADIRPTRLGLNFINRLNPVDFKWDLRDDYLADVQIIETEQDADGYLQEVIVEKLMPTKKDGSKKRKRYHQGFVAQTAWAGILVATKTILSMVAVMCFPWAMRNLLRQL